MFAKIGMNSKACQIRKEHIEDMPLPAILYWQQRHFVVLYGKTGADWDSAPEQTGTLLMLQS